MSRKLTRIVLLCVVALGVGAAGLYLWRENLSPSIRNVVIISIDTCRADRLGCYNSAISTTPNLDALANEGTLFTRAQSTNSLTLAAHCSMLTGTTPLTHRVHDNNNYQLSDENVTLAEVLSDHGLETGAVVAAVVLNSKTGLSQGFGTYDDDMPAANEAIAGWNLNERRGDEVSKAAIHWLEQNHEQPFLLFAHYFDPHHTYSPPLAFLPNDPTDPYPGYTGEIAYTDYCIGQVIKKLKELGVYDETLIIVTSDHAESLGEHGEQTHSYFSYESTIRVPFIVRMPGGLAGNRVDEPISIVDVMPTTLALLGIPASESLDGVDLTSLLTENDNTETADRYLYCESTFPTRYNCSPIRGLTQGKWKYLHSAASELFDLEKDPGETTNLVDEEPQIANDLDRQLREMFAARRPIESSTDLDASDQPDAEKLRSLSYVGGGRVEDADSYEGNPDADDPKAFARYHHLLLEAMGEMAKKNYSLARANCLEVSKHRQDVPDAHFLLGTMAREEGNHAEAIGHFNRYMATIPALDEDSSGGEFRRFDSSTIDALVQMGNSLTSLERLDEATDCFRNALTIAPQHGQAHWNLGVVQRTRENYAEAVESFRKACQSNPDNIEYLYALADVLENQHAHDEAIETYQRAIKVKPDLAGAHFGMGRTLISQGKFDEGRQRLLTAGQLDRTTIALAGGLAWTLSTDPDPAERKPKQALTYAEVAVELTRRAGAPSLDVLAAAYAADGQFDKAVTTAEEALAIAQGSPGRNLAKAIAMRLDYYRQSKPFVVKPNRSAKE